jgi:hypothetical protein
VQVTETAFDLDGMLEDRRKLIDYPLCSNPAKSPCIESLELIGKDGSVISAIPETKRTTFYNFAGLMSDAAEVYQWKTPGILHENGKDTVDLDVYRFPMGAPYCWDVGKCTNTVDEIVIYMFGGTRGQPGKKIEFPELADDKICGDANSPTECFRAWGLNPEYRYRVTLIVEKDFDFSHSNGEARDGTLSVKSLPSGEKRLTFSGSPVTFSTVKPQLHRCLCTFDKKWSIAVAGSMRLRSRYEPLVQRGVAIYAALDS